MGRRIVRKTEPAKRMAKLVRFEPRWSKEAGNADNGCNGIGCGEPRDLPEYNSCNIMILRTRKPGRNPGSGSSRPWPSAVSRGKALRLVLR